MWEIAIADIAVANGFTSIADSAISPRQEWVNAPPAVYIDSVLNNFGARLIMGKWSFGTRRLIGLLLRLQPAIQSVWRASGRGKPQRAHAGAVLRLGIGYVKVDAAVTRGDLLDHKYHCGSAATIGSNSGGLQCENWTDIGNHFRRWLALTFVGVEVINDFDYVLVQDQKANTTTGGTTSRRDGAWTTSTLNTEVRPHNPGKYRLTRQQPNHFASRPLQIRYMDSPVRRSGWSFAHALTRYNQ